MIQSSISALISNNRSLRKFLLIFYLLFIILSCTPQVQEEEASSSPPNILLIISDDQAWSDYSFMGHEAIETPRIDQLAQESLTFTRAYVSAPLCSPSLATIISGLYPHQHGITGNDPAFEFEGKRYTTEWRGERQGYFDQLKRRFYDNKILTQYLGDLGYMSIQTGKWWLGSWEEGYFTHGMTHGDYTKGGRHGDDGLTIGREGLDPIYNFIEEADSAKKPFFVWYAPFLPHSPHTPPEELEKKYLEKAPTPAIAKYWAMCEWFDQTCGDLLDYLDEKQLAEETLVIYVCDNGWIQQPDKVNRYAPRSKRTPYEGGIRTPIMFKWPGKIAPKMDSTTLASSIDIVPTILAACELAPESELPGVNIMNRESLQIRETIFAEAFEHDVESVEDPNLSLTHRIAINHPWKLILPDSKNAPEDSVELFNLEKDPTETTNIAEEQTEILDDLKNRINQWWYPEYYSQEK